MAISAGLLGCAPISDPTIGRGTLALSAETEQAFADYKALPKPRYFAVSTDGNAYYYSYCGASRCRRQPKTNVIASCQSYSDGVPCWIYGSHGKVVWINDSP